MQGAMIAQWLRRPLAAAMLLAGGLGVANNNAAQTPPVLPQGGTVTAGSAQIVNPNAATLNINQSTRSAVINWQSFSVGQAGTVNFNQPDAASSTLNRVSGATPTSVAGAINAPGKVLLINPNGIAFTKDAKVNVGSVVASSLNIRDEDYLAGKLTLQGSGASAAVSNAGSIQAADGGFVALVGGSVSNTGSISANLGKVGLGAGEYVTIDPSGDGFLQVAVPSVDADKLTDADGKPIAALINQAGTIDAAGGKVVISAAAARTAAVEAVNISGTVRARSVSQQNGSITLSAGDGTAMVSGTLDASGVNAGEKGGKVVVLGRNVGLVAGAKVDASGAAGGGKVELGGSARGEGPLPNADGFYMDKNASIDASATQNGDGGQVVTWGTDSNRSWGTISARGAGDFGKGGLVETSGHWLDVSGAKVNLRGDNGIAGEWLLDPTDITISIALSVNGSLLGGLFTPLVNALTSIINTGDLLTALSTAGTVTISSASSAGSNGTLTLANVLTYNSNNAATLNLISDSTMALNAAIYSIGNGTLNLNLTSGGAFSNSALSAITLGGNSAANVNITAGGPLTLNAGIAASTPGLNLNLNSGGLLTTNVLAPINYTGNQPGSVTFNGAGGISLFNNITSSNARLNITQIAGNGTTAGGVITLNNGVTLNANGGNISLSNALIPSVTNVHGIYFGNLTNLTTSGTGGINVVGYGNGTSWGGISFAGGTSTLTSGSGGISLLGSSDHNSGISFGNGAFSSTSLTSAGAISIDGRQTNSVLSGGLPVGYNGAVGFYGTTNINATGALSIIGTSEQGIGAPGIAFLSTPTVTLRGSSVSLTGTNNSNGVSGDATRTGAGLRIDTPITLIANSGDITLTGVSKSSFGAGINIGAANTYTLAAGRGLIINGSNTTALTNTAVNIAGAINVAARPLTITGTGLTSITAPLTAANVSIVQNATGFTPASNAITLGNTITASGSLGVTSSTGNILSSSTFTSGTGQYAFATLGGGGNITFNNAVSYTGAAAGSFSALADGVLSNRSIGSTVAAMDITLSALNTASASASGLLLAGTSLNANGGNITLTGVGRGAGIVNDASSGAGLGLTGTSSIVTSGSGRISIDARNNGGANNPAALFATGTSTITSGTGGTNILAIGGTGSGIQLGQGASDATTVNSTGAITLNGSTSATAAGAAGVVLGRTLGIASSGALSITGTASGSGSQGGVVQINPGTQTLRGTSVSILGNTAGSGVGVGLTGITGLTADTGNITLDGTTSSTTSAAVNIGGTLTTTLSAGAAASLNLIGTTAGNSCLVTPALNTGLAAINIIGNGIHSVGALTGGVINVAANGTGLTNAVSAITLGGDITATGAVNAVAQTGRVAVNGSIVTTATGASAVVLAAGAAAVAPVPLNTDALGNVVLGVGKTITTGAGGRVLVYTGSVANTTGFDVLAPSGSGRYRYGRLYSDTTLLSGGTGVFVQYRERPILSLTLATPTRVYDAQTLNNGQFSVNLANYAAIAGFLNGDTSSLNGGLTGSLAFNGSVNTAVRNAGTYTLGVGTLNSLLGYGLDISVGVPTLIITPRPLNLTAAVDTRQYNGGTASTAAPVLGTLLGTDTSTGVGAQVFANKNAGIGKVLMPSVGSIQISDGNGGNNYSLTAVNATGTITAAPLTVTATAGAPKTYDGTTASIATPVVSGLFGSDAVTGTGVQAFADKNVGNAKIQIASAGSLVVSDGNGGNNYALQFVQNAAGSIVPAAATLRANLVSKQYDGGTSSSVTPSLLGAVGADVAVGTGSQVFDTKHVGAGVKVVTPSLGTLRFVDGNGVDVTSNYTISLLGNTVSSITPATLTLTASAAVPKIYNGALDSAGVPVVSGLLGTDSVTGQAVQAFTDKNAGTGKTITASIGGLQINDGNSGNNYQLALVNSASGVITPASITVSAVADRKTYDGNTGSLVTPQITAGALQGSDTFTSRVQVFADKHAGTGKTLTPSVVINDGNGGNNYAVTLASSIAGIIDPRTLRVVPGSASKVYDGTTASVVLPSVVGLRNGDSITGQAVQVFDSRNVGTSKTLTASLGTMAINDGNSGHNYNVVLETADVGTVTARPITLTAAPDLKSYDGTLSSSAIPLITVGALQSGDSATLSQVYTTKNAGTGLTLAPNAVINDGNGGNNYTIARINSSNGTIERANIEVSATTNSRLYDGGVSAATLPTVTSGSLQGTDGFSTLLQQYTGKNVGAGLTLVPTAVINDGNNGGNYNLTLVNSSGGTITARPITLTAVTDQKVYDGTTASSLQPLITVGALQGADTFTTRAQVFANKNAGSGKTLTPSIVINDGNGGSNYAVTLVNNTTGAITPRTLRVVPGTVSKVYDGTTASIVAPDLIGLQTGDSTTGSATQIFDTRNVGTGKTLTAALGTLAISDGNSGNNYSVVLETAGAGTITARPITLTATAASKNYDGTVSSVATPLITVGALQSGDSATLTQVYSDRNAGSGLTLTPTATISDGNGGNNYVVTTVNSANGTINRANIEITASTNSRVYDGTLNAANLPTITQGSLQGTDGFTTLSQQYTGRNVGSGLTLNPFATINDGNGGNNYNVSLVSSSGGTITARPIVVTAATDTKAYDRTTASSVIPILTSGSLAGGDLNAFTQTFDNGNIGVGKALTPGGIVNDGNGGANYAVTFVNSLSGTITQRPITVTAQTNTKTYDGTTSAAATPGITLGSLLSGDTANFSQLYQSRNAGTGLTLIPTGTVNDGNGGQNYLVTFVNSASGTINARALTLTAAADSKTYDGALTSAVTPLITAGALQTGDSATLTQAFLSKNVGSGLTIAPSLVINDGNGGNNYVVTRVNSANGAISRANIEITATTNSRQYDGSLAAANLPTVSSGALQGTDGFSTFAQQYSGKNVGSGLTLTPFATINDGNSGNNYNVSLVSSSGGTITARPIVVTAAADTKAYDRTTSSSVIPVLTSGSLVSGDLNAFTQTFDNGNIGVGKTLTPGGVVNDGNGGANYAVTFINSLSGTITQRPITVTAQANTKTYDGTTSASATPGITQGSLLSGDTANFSQLYQGRNAGTGLTLIPTGTVSDGNGGQNYLVTFVNSASGTINARALTLTAAADTKSYDGSVNSSVAPVFTVGALQPGDTATLTQAFLGRNAGTGLTLVPTAVINDGNGGNNYVVTGVNNANGIITRANIQITATTSSRQYDGTVNTTSLPTISSGALQGTDGFSTFAQQYSGKNVGSGLTLNPLVAINDGNSGNNYNVSLVSSSGGAITARPITVTAAADSKAYDRTTASSVIPVLSSGSIASGDTSAFTQVFDNANIGVGKTLTASGIVSDGNGGGNYAVTFLTSTGGTITKRPITVTAQANTKTYDGTTSAAAVPGVTQGSLLSGDVANFSQLYQSKNAGVGLTLIPTGTVSDGNGGLNYAVTFVNSSTGVINPLDVTITAAAASKQYDGYVSSSVAPLLPTLLGSDSFSGSGVQTYVDKHAGIGKTLTPAIGTLVINDGNGGNNYRLNFQAASLGDITRAPLTLTATANTRVYNGGTDASAIPVVSGGSLKNSDTFTSLTEAYASKNAGTGLTLIPTATINDGNGGNNYLLTLVNSTAGVITKATATLVANAVSKQYDGSVSSIVTPTFAGLLPGDTSTGTGSQVFSDKHVGTNKVLTPTQGTLSINDGNSGNNYNIVVSSTAVGTITPAPIQITGAANSKTYDGTTSAATAPTVTGGSLKGSDSFASLGQVYATDDAGTGLTLIPTAAVADGNGGNNYALTFVNSNNGVINRAPITITASVDQKTYDGTTTSALTPQITSGTLFGTDGFTTLGQSFSNKNAGTGKSLVPVVAINDGNNGNNYLITAVNNVGGTIDPLAVTVAGSRTYNGIADTSAAANVLGISNVIGSDAVTLSSGAGVIASGNAGAQSLVSMGTLTLSGADAGNYSLLGAGGVLTINPLAISVALNGTRTYDASTAMSSSLLSIANNLDGGNLVLNGTGVLSSANAGTQALTSTAGALTGLSLSGAAASNYTTTGGSGSVTVAPRAITVTAQSGSKTYDGTLASSLIPQVTGGSLAGNDSNGFFQQYSSRNVGSGLTLTAGGIVNDGNGGANYAVSFASSGGGSITPRAITVAPASYSKVYDGTTVAGGAPVVTSGSVVAGDTPNFTQVFSTDNVGTGLTLTPSGSVNDGNGGANYAVAFVGQNIGTITRRPITVTAQSNVKTYDGTVSATATPSVTVGTIAFGDVAAFTESYVLKNAGTNLTLTPAGIVNDGNNGLNYDVTYVNSSNGTITPRALNLTAQAGSSRQYDGTVNSSVAPVLDALVGGDTYSGVASQRYSDGNAGTGKTMLPSLGNLVINDGNGGNNYSIVAVNAVGGEITRAPITVSASAGNKTYDGTTVSTALPSITSGTLFGTDTFSTLSQAYQNRNAGTGLTLIPTVVINDGNAGSNYVLTLVNNSTGVIGKANVALTAQTASKVYDATVSTTVTPQLGQLFQGDTFSGSGTQVFTSKNVGSGLTLTPQLGTLAINDGNGGNNYNIVLATSAGGAITPAALTLTAVAGSKAYDGTVNSATAPLVSGLMGSDSITGAPAQVYTGKNAGSNLTLTPTLGTLVINDGNGGLNYAINAVSSSGGSIAAAPITISATANTKTYDGTLTAVAVPAITSGALQGTDTFASNIETYASKNAGSGLTLIPTVVINDGNGGNNYVVTLLNNTTGVINKATATLAANPASKTYDGTTATVITPSFEGLAPGDTVTGLGSQAFLNPNAGSNKVLIPSLGTLSIKDGNNGNNYDIVMASRSGGTINPLAVQLQLQNGVTRSYDGTTSLPTSLLSIVNNLDGANLALAGTASLLNKNAGAQPLLTVNGALDGVSLTGAAAGNYTVLGGSGLINVAPVPITVSVSSGNKVYDGTLAATVNPLVVGGSLKGADSFGAFSANYASRNVGTGIAITPNVVINDGNSGNNYVVSVTPGIGDITPALATLAPTSLSKVYDGTTLSSVGPTVLGLATGDYITGSGSQQFSDRNAGVNKVLSASLGTIVIVDGNGGGNYILTTQNGVGTITQAPLTLTASGASKSYDGTTVASGAPLLAGLVAGDSASGSGLQAFANKNAGVNKELLPSLGSILISDGNGGNNYALNLVSSFDGNITPAAITVTAGPDAKVYDGTTAGIGLPTITSGTLFSGDVAAFTNTFATRNVGSGITLTPTGNVNDGNNGGNYVVTRVTRDDGSISKAVLTIVVDPKTRPMGAENPVFTGSVTGFVGGDTLESAVDGQLTFTTDATATSPEGFYSITGSGLSSSNYTLVQASGNNAALEIAGQMAQPTPRRIAINEISSEVASNSLLHMVHSFELPLIDAGFLPQSSGADSGAGADSAASSAAGSGADSAAVSDSTAGSDSATGSDSESGAGVDDDETLAAEEDVPTGEEDDELQASLLQHSPEIDAGEENSDEEQAAQSMQTMLKCPPRFTCSQKELNLRGAALAGGRINTQSGPRVIR